VGTSSKFISTKERGRWHMKRGVFFVLTWLTATAVGWGQSLPTEGDPKTGIPFEVNRQFGSILIRAQVNGQPATLIVDTGCSHTVLSSDFLRVSPLLLEHASVPVKGQGLVGVRGWAKATMEIGAISWANREVLVIDEFQEISKSMKQRVDGILGEDLLNEFGSVVIDFKHHRLVLLR
jgi:hypothetical protein